MNTRADDHQTGQRCDYAGAEQRGAKLTDDISGVHFPLAVCLIAKRYDGVEKNTERYHEKICLNERCVAADGLYYGITDKICVHENDAGQHNIPCPRTAADKKSDKYADDGSQ